MTIYLSNKCYFNSMVKIINKVCPKSIKIKDYELGDMKEVYLQNYEDRDYYINDI